MNDTDPLYLLTDACDYGIGAYLYQLVQGKECPIRFMSRVLWKPQDNWSTIEKGCYAIFVALCEFDYYLLGGRHFFLLTDHRNLVYMKFSQKKALTSGFPVFLTVFF
jgi:hypothetical protein